MRGVIFSVIAIGALSAVSATPAAAYDYPYCLQSRSAGIPGDCSYQTYAQCQASASGRLASCNINPRVAFARRGRDQGYYDPGYRRNRYQYRQDYDGDYGYPPRY